MIDGTNNSNETDDRQVVDTVLTQFPYPIARCVRFLISDSGDGPAKVYALVAVFEIVLRYLLAITLAEYRHFPGEVAQMTDMRQNLASGSTGRIWDTVRETTKRLVSCNHLFFVKELPAFIIKTTKRNDIGRMIQFRNGWAHGAPIRDWQSEIDQFYPQLLRVLTDLEFLASYQLFFRIGDGSVSLHGFNDIEDRCAPETLDGKSVFPLHLRNNADPAEGTLSLAPFARLAPTTGASVFKGYDVEMLSKVDRTKPDYTGLYRSESGDEAIDDPFAVKEAVYTQVPASTLSDNDLAIRCAGASNSYFYGLIERKVYIPETFIFDLASAEVLADFYSSPFRGMVVLGESGMGKTSMLCHWARQLISENRSVLYLPAADLDPSKLATEIARQLGILGKLADLAGGGCSEGRPLTIILDGINESPRALDLFRAIHQLLTELPAWEFKIIISLRTSYYPVLMSGMVGETSAVGSGDGLYYTTVDPASDTGAARPYHMLSVYEPESQHLAQMYENYREFALIGADGSRIHPFRPLSEFDSLSRQLKTVMATPLFMRLVTTAYTDREIPNRALTVDILHEYTLKVAAMDDEAINLITQIAGHMLNSGKVSVSRSDLKRDPNLQFAFADTPYVTACYSRLVDAGYLVEIPEYDADRRLTRMHVRFGFDRLHEYALSIILSSAGGTPEALIGIASNWFMYPPIVGAIEFALLQKSQDDNGDLIAGCLKPEGFVVSRSLLGVMDSLQAAEDPAYTRLMDLFVQCGNSWAANLMYELARTFLITGRGQEHRSVLKAVSDWTGENDELWKYIAGGQLLATYADRRDNDGELIEIYNRLKLTAETFIDGRVDQLTPGSRLSRHQINSMRSFGQICAATGFRRLYPGYAPPLYSSILSFLNEHGLEQIPDLVLAEIAVTIEALASQLSLEHLMVMDEMPDVDVEDVNAMQEMFVRKLSATGIDLRNTVTEHLEPTWRMLADELTYLLTSLPLMKLISPSDFERNTVALVVTYARDRRSYRADIGVIGQSAMMFGIMMYQIAVARSLRKQTAEAIRCVERSLDYLLAYPLLPLAADAAELKYDLEDPDIRRTSASRLIAMQMVSNLSEPNKTALQESDIKSSIEHAFPRTDKRPARFEELADVLDGYDPTLLLPDDDTVEAMVAIRLTPWRSILADDIVVRDDWFNNVPNVDIIRAEERLIGWLGARLNFNGLLDTDGYLSRTGNDLEKLAEAAMHISGTSTLARTTEASWMIEVQSDWPNTIAEKRPMLIVQALSHELLERVSNLDDDDRFCSAIKRPCGERITKVWIGSLIKCWIADIRNGKIVDDILSRTLADATEITGLLTLYPIAALPGFVACWIWQTVRATLSPNVLDEISALAMRNDTIAAVHDLIVENCDLPGLIDFLVDLARDRLVEYNTRLTAELMEGSQ